MSEKNMWWVIFCQIDHIPKFRSLLCILFSQKICDYVQTETSPELFVPGPWNFRNVRVLVQNCMHNNSQHCYLVYTLCMSFTSFDIRQKSVMFVEIFRSKHGKKPNLHQCSEQYFPWMTSGVNFFFFLKSIFLLMN